MNPCDTIRELLLELDWSAKDRHRAGDVVRHLESCPACATAAKDFKQLRSRLTDARTEIPPIQWVTIEGRLRTSARKGSAPKQQWWIAAAVLLGALRVGLVHFTGRTVDSTPSVEPATNLPGAFGPGEVAQQVDAFNQISSAFDHRATWVLNSAQEADVGIGAGPLSPQYQVLLVRLTMEHPGAAASVADLAIVPGATAKVFMPISRGNQIEYEVETSADQPTRLTFWARLNSPHGEQMLGAMASSLTVRTGEGVTAGHIITSAGNYQLNVAFARCDLSSEVIRDEH